MRPWTGSESSNTYETRAAVSRVANGLVSSVICIGSLSPPIAIHGLVGFLAGFLVALVLAPVPSLLALRQSNFALGDAVTEVYPQGNDRQTFGLRASGQLVNFLLVQKQLARSQRLVIPGAAGHILGDVCVDQPRATRFEIDVGVANVGFSLPQGLHLGAVEDHAGLKTFEKVVVVRGGTVLRDDLLFRLVGLAGLFGFFGRSGHSVQSHAAAAI